MSKAERQLGGLGPNVGERAGASSSTKTCGEELRGEIAMNGTSRLPSEKRGCLSAVSSKGQPTTSTATNDAKDQQLSTEDEEFPWKIVSRKKKPEDLDMENLYKRSEYSIEKYEINRQVEANGFVQKVGKNSTIQPSKINTPKPPPKKPPPMKQSGTINGKSWAEVTAEADKKEKGEMNEKHAERSRRTFIIRRAPFNFQPEEVLEALSDQFSQDLGEVAERIESLTRDKYDRRRLYVTFKQYEEKKTVAQRGFRIGNVTIPGEPGDVSGLITDVPHYLDLDDMTQLLAPYGTIIRHRFRTYTNTKIRKGTYDFDLQLHVGKQMPTELPIYNDVMTVLDKNQRKQCTYCNRYGHLSSYCRKRMEKEMEVRQEGAEQIAEVGAGSTLAVETAAETETGDDAGAVGGAGTVLETDETDFVAEVVTTVVADVTAEVVTDVTAEAVVDDTAVDTTEVTVEIPPAKIDDGAVREDGQRAGSDDHMEVSDEENLTERESTCEDDDDDIDDVELETVRKRTTEDEDQEAKKKKLLKREELCTKGEARETRKEKAMTKEEQDYKEKMKRYYARKEKEKELEDKKKREKEEEEKKNMQKKKEKHENEGDETLDVDEECRRLEKKLNTGSVCNGSRQYTTLSSTPIANKNWVKQAWTPKNKNPSVEIPLRKIDRHTTFPEEEIGAYNAATGNIVRNAIGLFKAYDFGIETVVELSKCRTKLHITCTKSHKNPRIRNLQMRAFIGIIDSICELGNAN